MVQPKKCSMCHENQMHLKVLVFCQHLRAQHQMLLPTDLIKINGTCTGAILNGVFLPSIHYCYCYDTYHSSGHSQ